jgi:hypothetical protein
MVEHTQILLCKRFSEQLGLSINEISRWNPSFVLVNGKPKDTSNHMNVKH